MIKLCGATIMALFGSFDYVPQGVAVGCAGFMLMLLGRQSSCTVYIVDFWRAVGLWLVIFLALISLAVIGAGPDQSRKFGLYSFFLGGFLILTTAAARWWKIQRIVEGGVRMSQRRNPLLEQLISSRGPARESSRESSPVSMHVQ